MLRERGADVERVRDELAIKPYSPPTTQQRTHREIEKLDKILADAPKRTPARSREDVFGRYTVTADRLIFFAKHHAGSVGAPVVETEHLLFSVVREGSEHFKLFFPFADSKDTVCKQMEEHLTARSAFGLSERIVSTEELPPVSEEFKRVLGYADEEATMLGSKHIAPEHLLLGMLREKDSYAATVLRDYGAELEHVRRELAA